MPSKSPSRASSAQQVKPTRPTRSVALLRGINVGGHRSIKMGDLREWLVGAGFSNVETYLQSGNVLFTHEGLTSPAHAITTVIAEHAGFEVQVFIRTSEELDAAVSLNPFSKAEPTHLHLAFLDISQRQSFAELPDTSEWDPELFHANDGEVYLFLPNGMGRAVLPRKLPLLKQATIRNWKTVCSLADLAQGR